MDELFAKLERFKKQKEIDSDLLVRWCPKQGCGEHMKAKSLEEKMLICHKC